MPAQIEDGRSFIGVTEAGFAELLDLAPDAIITVDESSRIVHFSRGASSIFGYSPTELLGRPLDLLLPERARAVHEEHMRRFANSPETSRKMGGRRPIAGLRKGGAEFPAEASISKLDLGGRRLLVVWLRDITERRRAEAAQEFLARAGERLATSLDYQQTLTRVAQLGSPILGDTCIVDVYRDDGSREVAVADADPALEDLVRAMRLRYPPLYESAMLSDSREARLPVLLTTLDDSLLGAMAADEEHHGMLCRLGPRSAMFIPLVAREHSLGILSCYVRGRTFDEDDLTLASEFARRAALALDNALLYERAQRATRSRDEVLGIVSHDLRNPLNTIRICAGALLDPEPAPPEGVRAMAEAIRHSAEWANAIIRDLLDVTSLEAGRLSLHRRPVVLAELFEQVRVQLLPQAEQAQLALVIENAPGLPPVDVDPERMLQVLFNLVGNALKFTPAGGRIDVSASYDERTTAVRVSITDTGVGIAPQDLPNIFDRFWQARHNKRGGAGLGLAIARGIVEAHGGMIEVHSVPERGTSFAFTLPVADAPLSLSS